jgi:UDP-N-acetylglucosamine diphosphorylase / glucose-1-phosphate thymidylyltransferase / UDP-N-acetylgalactosamine diphosphorylase / glucosamine-1-phosphate N-acetyltransferase / galactosamine-1-phosphate N-acetyltransferase
VSALYLYDDTRARAFEPFALTRPVAELRAGALLVRERWSLVTGRDVAGSITSEHLASFEEPGAAPIADGSIPAGALLVNARAQPALQPTNLAAGAHVSVAGRLAAVTLARDVALDELQSGDTALESLLPADARPYDVPGHWLDDVWHLVGRLEPMLQRDIQDIAQRRGLGASAAPTACHIIGWKDGSSSALFLEDGAKIEPFVTFDLSAGSIYVERGATVQSFTRISGPFWIGADSVVGSDRVAACSVGAVCKVHGEVSHTVFLGHCNKGHDGFVGHSYLGRWVNLGANTVTSNLKNTYTTVDLWTPSGVHDTNEQFLGTLFGDHAKTGIGLKLTTGTVLGAGAQVYGTQMPPKVVPPFAWGERAPYQLYRLDKFLEVAERMMARRHMELSARARRQLTDAHARAQDAGYAPSWRVEK